MYEGDYTWDESMTFESRVIVNGVTLTEVSWELDRELVGVPGISDDTAANGAVGTVVISPDADDLTTFVDNHYPTPWRREGTWPPLKGDTVSIDVRSVDTSNWNNQFTGTWYRRFTGTVDSAYWDSDGNYTIDIVDRIDRFTRSMSKEPVLQGMPPQPFRAGQATRFVDLQMATYIEEAMSIAGFDACIPRMPLNECLRIPLCGSLWPSIGVMDRGGVTNSLFASRYVADGFGYGMTDFDAYYASNLSAAPMATTTPSADCTMYLRIPPVGTDGWGIHVYDYYTPANATSDGFYVYVNPDGTVDVYAASDHTISVTIPAKDVAGGVWMLRTGQDLNFWTNSGYSNSITATNLDIRIGGVHMWTSGPNAKPGGFSAAYFNVIDDEYQDKFTGWTPNATIPHNDNLSGMTAGRQIVEETLSDILSQVCTAGVCHWGIDEEGKAVVIPILQRIQEVPVLNLVDDTDIYDKVSWTSALQASACQVKENLQIPQVNQQSYPSVQVWQGSSDTITAWQTTDTTISIPDNEDWYYVDATVTDFGYRMSWDSYGTVEPPIIYAPASKTQDVVKQANAGRGSVFMATVQGWDSNGNDTVRLCANDEYNAYIGWTDSRTLRLQQSAPKGGVDITTASGSSGFTWLIVWLRNQPMPILRAMAKVTWLDGWTTSEDNGSDAPVYEHDVGWWAGDNGHLTSQQLLDMLTEGLVQLGDLNVRPDPRIQLGDATSVNLTTIDMEVNGCLSKVSESFGDNGYSQTVHVIVGSHQVTKAKWAEFERVWSYRQGDRDWDAVETVWDGKTWNDFQDSPLLTEPS